MLTVVVIADRTTYTMRKNYGVQLKCLDTVLETVLLHMFMMVVVPPTTWFRLGNKGTYVPLLRQLAGGITGKQC